MYFGKSEIRQPYFLDFLVLLIFDRQKTYLMDTKWIEAGLQKPGKSNQGLAKVLGRSPSVVTAILQGKRQIKAYELPQIARYLEVDPPALVPRDESTEPSIERIKVRGLVQAGVFREASEEELSDEIYVTVLRDPRYEAQHMFVLKIVGQSINKQAADGSYVVCLSVFHAPRRPHHGDWVIVRAMDHGRAETTVKQLRVTDGVHELWPDSTDQRYQQPIVVGSQNGQSVEIIAFVTEFIKPATRL